MLEPGGGGGGGLLWCDITTWSSAGVEGVADALKTHVDALRRQSDDLAAVKTDSVWVGAAAKAARKREATLRDRLEQRASELATTRSAVFNASDGVRAVEQKVRHLLKGTLDYQEEWYEQFPIWRS